MRIALTGSTSFIGWHLRCAHRARFGKDPIILDRSDLQQLDRMVSKLQNADAIIHLAAVNRAADENEILNTNSALAEALVRAIMRLDRPISVVHANSIHADGGSAFGQSKRMAAAILSKLPAQHPLIDVYLPNVFGEHGTPFYNSFVATFCAQIAEGHIPQVVNDRAIPLLHAQSAVDCLLDAAHEGLPGIQRPAGTPIRISEVKGLLEQFSNAYSRGEIPDLRNPLHRDLFNTYRSFTYPAQLPKSTHCSSDARGSLFEAVRGAGSEVQVFVSTTHPGKTRGEHFHRRKFERFLVIQGQAVIRMRRLFTDDIVEFHVSGDMPTIVDMPTLWAHSISNIGESELMTLFFADQRYLVDNSDTYAERVDAG